MLRIFYYGCLTLNNWNTIYCLYQGVLYFRSCIQRWGSRPM